MIALAGELFGDQTRGEQQTPERVPLSGEVVPHFGRAQTGIDPHEHQRRAPPHDIGEEPNRRRASLSLQTSQSFLAILSGMYTSVTKLMSLLERASISILKPASSRSVISSCHCFAANHG